ncbi:SGNH/GDSL hydrolase family protein [Arthrobacter sp. ATA002]|uniref:SGNH/GDSL hydrolase family protein n=1 Tax=Arthrobacter sp. ATA002 TaxID=2991715 RepID=UPI0022A68F38|nr:SGNH/GDSL hydrolase family protein [Arthrobacter sp. ATA002]WAP51410.1 SGNH/GDSL hydrolase family protein [Arthrobacter sp. ATA002]
MVLLGDSFAAGEGAGSYEPVNGVAESLCHHSSEALVAGAVTEHAIGSPGVVVHNFACSRARIAALKKAQPVEGHGSGGVSAQLEQMARVRPDLVLLYLGGNDLGFADLLQACVAETDPCGQDPGLQEKTGQRLVQLRSELENAYRGLGAAARSPVLVLPYPRMFETGVGDCGRLTAGEQEFGLKITDALNETIEQAVLAAGLPNVRYVDALEGSFAGRGACSDDPLVNTARIGPLLGAATSVAASQEILHPTAEGYRILTADLLQWLEEHPA